MVLETGRSILKLDDDGKKYWENWDDGDKDSTNMDIGECIEFNPDNFEEGTIIKIIENVD